MVFTCGTGGETWRQSSPLHGLPKSQRGNKDRVEVVSETRWRYWQSGRGQIYCKLRFFKGRFAYSVMGWRNDCHVSDPRWRIFVFSDTVWTEECTQLLPAHDDWVEIGLERSIGVSGRCYSFCSHVRGSDDVAGRTRRLREARFAVNLAIYHLKSLHEHK